MKIAVMGVTGCGKTTIGQHLANHLGYPFFDGDDYHPTENVEKMSRGIPLDDDDRVAWLQKLRELLTANESAILACSALKAAYREQLNPFGDTVFLHLVISPACAKARLAGRTDHYMPASLVDSQFEALEKPHDAITLDGETEVDAIVEEAVRQLST